MEQFEKPWFVTDSFISLPNEQHLNVILSQSYNKFRRFSIPYSGAQYTQIEAFLLNLSGKSLISKHYSLGFMIVVKDLQFTWSIF